MHTYMCRPYIHTYIHIHTYTGGVLAEAAMLGTRHQQESNKDIAHYIAGFKSLAAGVRRLGADWEALQREQSHGAAARSSKVLSGVCVPSTYIHVCMHVACVCVCVCALNCTVYVCVCVCVCVCV
jgi:hypothetical protein